ncbi:MAG TPA: response regulator transcription factor [Planctomycetota bacterium]|nr:response regulator transcription factor [Planctomycetota bacterium]
MSRWILVAEDEGPLGEMLCDNLALEGYHAELVRSGTEALARMGRGDIDLLLLDVMLPGADGFEVLRQLRCRGDDTPVLILSARSADRDRITGLELRADDYLTKPFNLRELLLRVDALLRRRPAPTPGTDVLRFAGNAIDFRTMQATTFIGELVELTASEIKLLKLLAAHAGTVVTRKILVEHVFGSTAPLTVRTLDNMVLRLRKLFEQDPAVPRHFHTVRGVGIRFEG